MKVFLIETSYSLSSDVKEETVDDNDGCWACNAARLWAMQPGDLLVFENDRGERREVRALIPGQLYMCQDAFVVN